MMLPGGTFMQVCWVVDDLQTAMRRWHETTGVGPFYCLRSPPISNYTHRGVPGPLNMDVGLAQAGPIQIELIQPNNDAPSAYRDVFARGQEGMHHVGAITEDYDADYARYRALGFEEAQAGLSGTMHFAYFDTRAALGCMVELIERHEATLAMFKTIADTAVDWDGSDPYREIALPRT